MVGVFRRGGGAVLVCVVVLRVVGEDEDWSDVISRICDTHMPRA